jgi:inward rectifier potassium channel
MFRIANERDNQLIEVEVQVILSTIVEENGKEVRRYVGLELERGKVNFFPAAWTIVHPIDEKSPLWELDEMSFKRKSPELLILIKGFDDIFSSTVHARSSYAGDQFEWGKKFINVHGFEEDGTGVVHLNRLDDREPAKLNGMETPSPTPKQSTESAT